MEEYAAITVQRHFRGARVRSEIVLKLYVLEIAFPFNARIDKDSSRSFAAAEIQRAFRGWQGRQKIKSLKADAAARFKAAMQNYAAKQVQRVYRGRYSRRYTHDFFARRKYIIDVAQQGQALRETLQDRLDQQITQHLDEEERKAEAEFDKATQNLHHLVSTATIRGVFNPVYAETAEQIPSAFNVPLETHLRRGVKRFLRTQGMRTGSAFQEGEGGQPRSYVGTANTATVQPQDMKKSVRCSSAYGAEEEERRTQERHSRLRHLAPRAFTAGGRGNAVRHVKSIHAQLPYEPPGTAAIPDRTRDGTTEHKLRRTGTAVAQTNWRTSTAPVGGLFEDHALEALPSTAAVKASNTVRMLQTQGRTHVVPAPVLEQTARAAKAGLTHLLPVPSIRDLANEQGGNALLGRQQASGTASGTGVGGGTAGPFAGGARKVVRTSGVSRGGSADASVGSLLRKSVNSADLQGLQRMAPPPVDHIANRKQGLIHAGSAVLRQPVLSASQRKR